MRAPLVAHPAAVRAPAAGPTVPDSASPQVQAILRFKMRNSRPHVLVRWEGQDASQDTWVAVEALPPCEEALRAFERSRGHPLPRPAPPSPPLVPNPPVAPTGFALLAAPDASGSGLVGRHVLYWWPSDGWQFGSVARLCARTAPFSHVISYHRKTSSLRGLVDTALDPTFYGTRWVLLTPVPGGGPDASLAGSGTGPTPGLVGGL